MRIGTLDISEQDIKSLCRRWQIVELAVFPLVLHDDFGPHSDVDCCGVAPRIPDRLTRLAA